MKNWGAGAGGAGAGAGELAREAGEVAVAAAGAAAGFVAQELGGAAMDAFEAVADMDPTKILKFVYKIANKIRKQSELVKANKKQCARLASRVSQIESALQDLETLPKNTLFIKNLNALKACFEECLCFMETFAKKGWFKRVAQAKSNDKKFKALNTQLQELLPQLNVGLNAQMLINHEEDLRDAKADQEDLLANQKEIMALNQKMLLEVQRHRLSKEDLGLLMRQQNDSLLEALKGVVHPSLPSPDEIDPRHLAAFHELVMTECIGTGSFGKVYLGEYDTQTVAIKVLEELTRRDHAEFVREVKIMSRLKSNHVVQFYSACCIPERACIVMEYMDKGSLEAVLTESALRFNERLDIAQQLSKGLAYMHHKGVTHGDIKPGNVLLNSRGQAKWTDFGLAKAAHRASVRTADASSRAIRFMSPEYCSSGRQYLTPASDIYSFGSLLWTLWTGEQPFARRSDEAVVKALANGEHEEIPESMSREVGDLIMKCWHTMIPKRPSAENLVKALQSVRPPSPTGEEYYALGQTAERSKDDKTAYQNYSKSMKKGYVKAMTSVGLFSLLGKGGVAVDKPRAFQMFQRGATAEPPHVRAMFNLGQMLEYGDGVEIDLNEAKEWYEKAADLMPEKAAYRDKAESVRSKIDAAGNPQGSGLG